jgi:hypothetical protein
MRQRIVILAVAAVCMLALAGAGVFLFGRKGSVTSGSSQGPENGGTSRAVVEPSETPIPPTATPSVEEEVMAAFEKGASMVEPPLAPNEAFRALDVQIEGDWAFVEYTLVEKGTTNPLAGEATLALIRKSKDGWKAAFKGSDIYKVWLEEAPESLVPEDLKIWLR